MTTYVITFQEMGIEYVLGVADSVDRAKEMIGEYLDRFVIIKEDTVERHNIAYSTTIQIKGVNHLTFVSVQKYEVNKLSELT